MRLGKVKKGVPSHLKPDAITNQRSRSEKPCFARNCSVLVRDGENEIDFGDNGVSRNAICIFTTSQF